MREWETRERKMWHQNARFLAYVLLEYYYANASTVGATGKPQLVLFTK